MAEWKWIETLCGSVLLGIACILSLGDSGIQRSCRALAAVRGTPFAAGRAPFCKCVPSLPFHRRSCLERPASRCWSSAARRSDLWQWLYSILKTVRTSSRTAPHLCQVTYIPKYYEQKRHQIKNLLNLKIRPPALELTIGLILIPMLLENKHVNGFII